MCVCVDALSKSSLARLCCPDILTTLRLFELIKTIRSKAMFASSASYICTRNCASCAIKCLCVKVSHVCTHFWVWHTAESHDQPLFGLSHKQQQQLLPISLHAARIQTLTPALHRQRFENQRGGWGRGTKEKGSKEFGGKNTFCLAWWAVFKSLLLCLFVQISL